MNDDVVRVELTDIARTARAPRAELVLPPLIVDAGPAAVGKFLEFFAARIANRRTRAAYGRAVGQFLAWCAARGLGLTAVAPLHVAALHRRTHPGSSSATVKPVNPAAAVRLGRLARRHGRDAGALAGRGGAGSSGDRRARSPAGATGRSSR